MMIFNWYIHNHLNNFIIRCVGYRAKPVQLSILMNCAQAQCTLDTVSVLCSLPILHHNQDLHMPVTNFLFLTDKSFIYKANR